MLQWSCDTAWGPSRLHDTVKEMVEPLMPPPRCHPTHGQDVTALFGNVPVGMVERKAGLGHDSTCHNHTATQPHHYTTVFNIRTAQRTTRIRFF